MTLFDTLDGCFMNVAYGWALSKPVRKVYYNLVVTGLSICVAFVIGTIELCQVLTGEMHLRGRFWNFMNNFDINKAGFTIAGLFVVVWIVAVAVWRFGRVESRWNAGLAAAADGETGESAQACTGRARSRALPRVPFPLMSATLVAKGLAAGHGDRVLFSGLDLVVAPGDVIGLVGANGAGKSTLLRTLAGLLPAEQGSVRLNPPTATVGYLPQEPERRPGETVQEFLGRRTAVTDAQHEMDAAADALASQRPGADDDYAAALDRWLALGGADLAERTDGVWAELGLTVGLDQHMTELSGGQAARVGMASLLLSRYDIFLLDEPTNDLDLDGLDRLERFVSGLRAGTLLVSHDREFLTRTVTAVLELDLAQQQVNSYGGGYAGYLQERDVARRHARECTTSTPTPGPPWKNGPGCSVPGPTRACAPLGAKPPTTTRSAAACASSPVKSRPPRHGRPTACWNGWMWWRSRARSGSCACRSPPRHARARWWRRCAARSPGAATSRSGR